MFNDLIDLMGVQSKNIEHYKKYPIVLIFFMMLLFEIPFTFLAGGYNSAIASDLTINIIMAFIFTFVEAIFMVYWFQRVGINYSFLTFLQYDVILSVAAGIPVTAILFVIYTFESSPLIGVFGFLGAFSYVIYMFSLNLATATGSSRKYAFMAILLIIIFQMTLETLLL